MKFSKSSSLFAVIIWLLTQTTLLTAQTDVFANLPDCGFTAESGIAGLTVGAVILNLETGAGCTEHLDDVFQVASVPKIFVAGAYYDLVSRGLASMNTKLTFTDAYWMGGANDCLTQGLIGTQYTTRELVEFMLNCSDNAATWMLMDAIGRGAVQAYVDSTGIQNVGEIIPYSEVDKQKLTFLDNRWANVPAALASRFYRSRFTAGLDQYFSPLPNLEGNDFAFMNGRYLQSATTNTATPRAIADYLLKLRTDALNPDGGTNSVVAHFMFETMLYTQRLNSTQAFPGTLLVAAKNGFDRGLVAEVNSLFSTDDLRVPIGLAVIFTQQSNMDTASLELPRDFRGRLNRYLRDLSPQILNILYPDFVEPAVTPGLNISSVVFQRRNNIAPCWQPYFDASFTENQVDALEQCWSNLGVRYSYGRNEDLGMGVILRGLDGADTRLVFIYTAPDGTRYSYQTDRRYQDKAGIYWFHPLDVAGQWRVDIYLNGAHVYQDFVQAG